VREGRHITIVGTSLMVQEALHAADELVRHGVEAEVIDLRSVRPLDEKTIVRSIEKTGHLIVADTSWELCGVASEIAALAAEKAFSHLKAPVLRIALANCPAPVSLELEQAFYPKASTVARAALATLGDDPDRVGDLAREDHFKGLLGMAGTLFPCVEVGYRDRIYWAYGLLDSADSDFPAGKHLRDHD
jgi:acetoin:2,6-dichlorophenolindophenol oxidoreductase subunit beta